MFENLTFKEPEYFILLIIIPIMLLWYFIRERSKKAASIKVSGVGLYAKAPKTLKQQLRHLPLILRCITIALLIVVLARPQMPKNWRDIETLGIDIIIALDISTSMLAKDFEVNRMEASKDVAKEFVLQRKNDRIGLVLFSGRSFTQFPLTTDHEVLVKLLSQVETGMITDGTAIGLGLANAVRNLKNSFSKNKVVILLTDGVNNSGSIDPLDAGLMARDLNIRVYAIDIRENAEIMNESATTTSQGVDMGGQVLKEIARITGGQYFTSSDKAALRRVYDEIDRIEKSRISSKDIGTRDAFTNFAICALVAVFIEIVLASTILKGLP
ncbi:MAG TPA: VWA domain-containing protein [Cytophagales bacterium]|nr:VWA domain-containing protein [Cytophagales bacterium]